MPLAEIHARLGNTALLYFLIVALWGFLSFFRRRGVDAAYWGMLAIAELLVLAEAGLGLFLWLGGGVPARGLHILYGLLIPAMIPGAYVYTRGRDGRPEVLVYGTAAIITVGLIIRAVYTAEVAL